MYTRTYTYDDEDLPLNLPIQSARVRETAPEGSRRYTCCRSVAARDRKEPEKRRMGQIINLPREIEVHHQRRNSVVLSYGRVLDRTRVGGNIHLVFRRGSLNYVSAPSTWSGSTLL